MSNNTIIDGIAASEHLDSSGECLDIRGMDISSLGGPDSILNWEHGSKEKPAQVVGKVTFARKIMKEDDCKNKRERYFWNKVKKPFVYIKAELFDGLGHSGAQDILAMLKYKNKDKGEDSRLIVGFSIEGGKIDKKGMVVTKSIARDVAITVKPCNKVCEAEVVEKENLDDDFLYKNNSFECEILRKADNPLKSSIYTDNSLKMREKIVLEMVKNEFSNISKNKEYKPKREFSIKNAPKQLSVGDRIKYNKKPRTGKDIYEDSSTWETENNMRKALVAGMMGSSPDSRTGIAALTSEGLHKKKKEKKRLKKSETKKLPHDIVQVNPKYFHERIDRFRVLNDMNRANVHSYSPEDYSQMKTYMTRAGRHSFNPEYADPTNKLLHTNRPDFVEMSIYDENEVKKSQPSMSFQTMGVENKPEMQVKTIDPSKSFKTRSGKEFDQAEIERKKVANKYVQAQKDFAQAKDLDEFNPEDIEYIKEQKEAYGADVNPKEEGSEGINISAPEIGLNEAYEWQQGQSKESMKQTKGRGNFPSTKHHEGLHRTFSDLSQKTSKEHVDSLTSHLLDNFFNKDNVKSISDFVSHNYGEDYPHKKEEKLTHIIDLLTNKDAREKHEELFQTGRVSDIDYKDLKQGWKKAVEFTSKLNRDKLNKINDFYNKKKK